MNSLFRRLRSVNRFLLALGAGTFVSLVLLLVFGFLWRDEVFGPGWRMSLYQGLLAAVAFFGLAGVTAFVQQVNAPRGDTLRKRVDYLFAAKNISAFLIDFIEAAVKRNALYSSHTTHDIEVLEY